MLLYVHGNQSRMRLQSPLRRFQSGSVPGAASHCSLRKQSIRQTEKGIRTDKQGRASSATNEAIGERQLGQTNGERQAGQGNL
jgi:hypothetical protein